MDARPSIQRMVERMLTARGIDYQFARAVLEAHLKWITDLAFEAEIARVSNSRIFGTLWSMGMNQRRQDACVARASELDAAARD